MPETILDTFEGDPLTPLEPPWGRPVVPGGGRLSRNAGAAGSAGGFRGQVWEDEFEDVEIHATLELPAPDEGFAAFLYGRWDPETISGYYLGAQRYSTGESDLSLSKLVNGGSVGSLPYVFNEFSWATGDRLKIRVVGADLEGWRKPLGGEWEQLLAATDDDPIVGAWPIAAGATVIPTFADFGAGVYPYPPDPEPDPEDDGFPFGVWTTESARERQFRRFRAGSFSSSRGR
jgi:hypothetical protein